MAKRCFYVSAGLFLPALFGLAALLPTSAGAQPPTYLTQWGSLGSGDGQFSQPARVATDAAGNSRIQKFGYLPTPATSTSWGRVKATYRV